jgi:hypothetical protein
VHLGRIEPAQGDRFPALGERRERARRVLGELVVAVGPDHRERHRPVRLCDELQQRQRGRVGPLQVVEHDDQRPAPREPLEHARGGIEQAQPGGLRLPGVVGDRGRVGQLGEQPGQLGRVVGGDGTRVVRAGGLQQRPQGDRPGPEGGRAACVAARAPAHGQS